MNSIFNYFLKELILLSKQRVIVPFYHKVSDENATFEKHLYAARKTKDFKYDLNVFSKFYRPISLHKFIEISNNKKQIHQNYFHITFDDGLSNFYKIVAPILKERKIPATVFINTDFVDNKSLFFRYKASLLYQAYEQSSTKEKHKFYDFFQQKGGVKETLLSVNFTNKNILDDLAESIGYDFNEFLEKEKPYLTSKQIEDLMDMGFTIGAHSKDHPLYKDISLTAQLNQTKESIHFLTKKFNLDYKAFSFPFTDLDVEMEFFKRIKENDVFDFSFGSSGIKQDHIENNFQRTFFEIGTQKADYYLLKEYSKFMLKTLLRKNFMPRN